MKISTLGVAVALTVGAQSIAAQRAPSTAQTGPRADHAVGYYDERIGRVVVIDGAPNPNASDRDRVWSWSGTRWELVTDSGPPGRVNAGAAYDARRRKAVVAGGARKSADGSAWEIMGDSWEGDASGWRRNGDIEPRDHNALVTTDGGSVMMFGGIPAARSGAWPRDTWELTNDRWTRIASDGPEGRARTALAYDAKRKSVVLFGGVTASAGPSQPQVFLQDTWLWENGQWRNASNTGPRGRYAHAMVFDEHAGVVLLYSGSAAHSNAPLSDLWQWDGVRWTEIPLTGPTPGHRYQPVMVYDRARDRTVLFGGLQGPGTETWEWDGRQWREIKP